MLFLNLLKLEKDARGQILFLMFAYKVKKKQKNQNQEINSQKKKSGIKERIKSQDSVITHQYEEQEVTIRDLENVERLVLVESIGVQKLG